MRTTTLPFRLILGAGDGVGIATGDTTDTGADTGTEQPQGSTDTATGSDDTAKPDGTKSDEDETDWKAMARKHEREAKANRAAAAELEKIRAKSRTAEENAQKAAQDAAEDAAKARAELAVERAARKHGITDDKDLAVLAKVAPDDVDDVAKRLAAATKSAGRSGNDVGGSKSKGSPLDDPKKFAESLGNRKSGVTIY